MQSKRGVRRDRGVLAAILLAALALRLIGLNAPLWYDEILTLETHLRLPWSAMMSSYSMNHHYLYSFEAKALMGLFGEAPWVLRTPALVFGLASIAAAWWLARRLGGVVIAHVVALLLACSFHHIWFSQNARGYTELAFFCTLAMGQFLRATAATDVVPPFSSEDGSGGGAPHAPALPRLHHPQPPPLTRTGLISALIFALVLALAIFTHLTGAFFFLALGLVWAFFAIVRRFPRELTRWGLIGFGLGGALTLLLYAPVIASLTDTVATVGETTTQSAVPKYGNPLWTIAEAARTTLSGDGPLLVAAAALVLGLSVWGAVRSPAPAPLFGAAVLVHILVTMLLLKTIGMRIWPRFFFLDIGFLMILIALGVRAACRDFAARVLALRQLARPAFALAVLAMLAISGALAVRNYQAPKQDLAGAVAAAEQTRRPGERVYAVGYAADAFLGHFRAPWGRIMTSGELAAALAPPAPVTLVVGFPQRTLASLPELRRDLDAGRLRQVARLPGTLGDGAVLILRR